MINKTMAESRLDEINAELKRHALNPTITTKMATHMERLLDEGEELRTQLATRKAAQQWAGSASPSEYGYEDANPGDFDNNIAFKGFGPGAENRVRPVSMYELDKSQVDALRQASLQKSSFRVQIGAKGLEHGFMGGVHTKAAVTAGGLTPNLLPPVQQPGPGGFWGFPYESSRVANFLPNIAFDGPGMAYFQETAHGAEAGFTAENALKPDISPTVKEIYVRPVKVAGRLLLTHEVVQDAGDAFSSALTSSLAASVYNAESNLLLNAVTATHGFAGINNLTGALTRAAAIGTTDVDALDVLSKAFGDLRRDYFVPSVCFIHPDSLGSIRRLRDANKRLQLELMQGAGSIDQTSETETLWGVKMVQTTQQPAGTAAVLAVDSGAAYVYVREPLSVFFDPYSMASTNTYQYVAELRCCLGSPRSQAVALISGLPVI